MATIDLIVLGMIKQQPLSAYDIQKQVEYRNISKWVKISTPSIYKKVISLEEKGLIKGVTVKDGNMPEKAVYHLTENGEKEFEKLMFEVSKEPIFMFLDFNAVIVNLNGLPIEQRAECLELIKSNVAELKMTIEKNRAEKNTNAKIPDYAKAVLNQQYLLVLAIENWINSIQ